MFAEVIPSSGILRLRGDPEWQMGSFHAGKPRGLENLSEGATPSYGFNTGSSCSSGTEILVRLFAQKSESLLGVLGLSFLHL